MTSQLDPINLFKALTDKVRLSIILLLHAEKELCVCEFSEALDEIQPKISRNLALLKTAGLVVNRRQGQWIYYSINQQLPEWAQQVLTDTYSGNQAFIEQALAKLNKIGEHEARPKILCKSK
ncbi:MULTISPECIES: metalloregulator ArsR/SmtB family transcription factor [Shewanella]|uniref:Metalloregulator ArsR/SmtB family transcription factor n=1 Tax=Shewanella fidelis TaxID=173509 RepID=A0AAW8NJH4_9GAMM|nr:MULTISPECIES: metalloregulator ArsR/SmtB family transcription factor [Shewanella]MDR8523363.1 metalloregulator ArsR/SmtB family transcription factor [Shewanella fidelis]MDW4813403.1 metalloregulator ArsR/SmtB family transcription factor [Shewanella fidelis]MDW4817225.1 metalloregulator ArsR/SmtB family transcription factor [Shewanella fidelis]MDW4821418.1 metalloregulator ArsR/SmtB family transcription factor [Shewanella fidelis]MDW4824504.1 metalloregulator ArsR/SmtB family transcription f